ncbi:hypothetical protein SERN_1995 [Serinibacter arcticus]|uniref:Uncharacterized protein n=1 Tax=Serinibacter arcticus TaxID=1655435 RepID=A0A4Z1E142_9MICO|nr:hypothetical protein SERN_1995 [Serinibacter arcticus]
MLAPESRIDRQRAPTLVGREHATLRWWQRTATFCNAAALRCRTTICDAIVTGGGGAAPRPIHEAGRPRHPAGTRGPDATFAVSCTETCTGMVRRPEAALLRP